MAYQWTPDSKAPLTVEVYASQKAAPTLKGFQSEGSSHSQKELALEIDCNAKTALATTKLPGGLVEHLCVVDVGVYPMLAPTELEGKPAAPLANPSDTVGATYELYYEIAGVHALLYPNHMTVVNLMPNEERLFQFNIHEDPSVDDNLIFIMQMAFGKAELSVSKLERNPCKPSNSSNVFTISAAINKYGTLKLGKGGIHISDLKGSYYVCVRSIGVLTSLLVMPKPNLGTNSLFTSMNAGVLHLPPNHNLIGEITEDSASVQFTFTLNLDPKEDEIVIINVTPLTGTDSYRIIASCNGYEPNPHQEFWNTIGNTLTISSKDLSFRPKAEYRVKISIPSKNEYKAEGIHRFTIAYSIGLKDILLQEGLPYVGEFSNITREHKFRIEIPAGTKNLTILKSLIDHPYTIDCYIQSSNRSQNATNLTISTYEGGHIFDDMTLLKICPDLATTSCNLYMKANSNVSRSTYLLSFSFDNRPFTLHQDYGYNLPPSPTFGIYQFFFVYHLPTKHKNFTLDCENPYAITRCYLKFTKDTDEYSFPTRTSFTKLLIGEYSTVDLGPTNYQDNTVMLITIELEPKNDIMSVIEKLTHNFAFVLKGKIRVSAGPRKLIIGKPYKGKLQEKQWKYFQIHHKTNENLVVNFESSYSTCRLFISKGHDAKVSFNNHLESTYATQEKTLVVTPEKLRLGDSITGYYTLGVHCYANSTVRLVYRSSSAQNYELSLNDPTKIDLSPDQQTYIEFLNYGPKADIEILFRSPKAGVTILVTSFDPQTMLLANQVNDPQFKAPSMPQVERYDYGTQIENPVHGYGKLTIPHDSEKYCHYCRMVMLVQVTEPDTVEFIIKKSDASWPSVLSDGEEQFGLLKANEIAYYKVEAMRLNENVPATILLHRGHIKIDVSSKSFVNITTESVLPTEEIKGINKQVTVSEEPEDRFTTAVMFIRITAVIESRISLNFAENSIRQEIQPQTAYMSTLNEGHTKILTLNTQDMPFVHGSVKVTAVGDLDPEAVDDNLLEHAITKGLVSIFTADSEIEVARGKYFEVPTYIRVDKDRNRIEFKFVPNSRIAVIRLRNQGSRLLHFNIETTTKAITYVKPKERVVSALHPFLPYQVYSIPIPHERSTFTLDLHECVEHLVVLANFKGAGQSSEREVVMFDQHVDERRMPLNDGPGTLELSFYMREAFDRSAPLSFLPAKAHNMPSSTVFSFTYDIEPEADTDHIGAERFRIRNEVGEVQVHDLTGDVSIKKVIIDDLDGLLKGNSIRVIYSLVLARNVGMMNHLMRCGKYAIGDAKKIFSTDDYVIINSYDYITADTVAEQKKKEQENKYFVVKDADTITLSPSMYAFGDAYQAAVVARVLVFGNLVVFVNAGREHVPRRPRVHAGLRALRLRRQRGRLPAHRRHGPLRAALHPGRPLAVRQARSLLPPHEARLVQQLRPRRHRRPARARGHRLQQGKEEKSRRLCGHTLAYRLPGPVRPRSVDHFRRSQE